MPDPLTRPPLELAANTSVAWRFEDSAFPPADGWTLDYAFEGPEELDVAAIVDGAGFLVELDPTQTALTAGVYRWQAFASRVGPPSERVQVGAGRLRIVQDLEAETGLGEQLDHARQVATALEAYILGRATDGQRSLAINGRSIDRIPILEARQLLHSYRREIRAGEAAERAGVRPGTKRPIRVRF